MLLGNRFSRTDEWEVSLPDFSPLGKPKGLFLEMLSRRHKSPIYLTLKYVYPALFELKSFIVCLRKEAIVEE